MSYTTESISKMKTKGVSNYKKVKSTLLSLKKTKPSVVDNLFHNLHHKEFEQIDCLECANCCKTISPAIKQSDVKRMAKSLKIKPSELIDAYLVEDDEGDFVFTTEPCPFLGSDNYCSIYNSRPKACREYPHTDRDKIFQILQLTAKNYKVCPAVFNMVEKLISRY